MMMMMETMSMNEAAASGEEDKYKEMEESISSCVRLSLSADNEDMGGSAVGGPGAAMDTLVSALKPFRKKVKKRQKKAAAASSEAEAADQAPTKEAQEQDISDQMVLVTEEETDSIWHTIRSWQSNSSELAFAEDDASDQEVLQEKVSDQPEEETHTPSSSSEVKKKTKGTTAASPSARKAVEECFSAMSIVQDALAAKQAKEQTLISAGSSNGRRRHSSHTTSAIAPSSSNHHKRIPRKTMPARLKSHGSTRKLQLVEKDKSKAGSKNRFKRSLSLGANLAGTGFTKSPAPTSATTTTTTKEPDFNWKSNSDHQRSRRQSDGAAAAAAAAAKQPDFDWKTSNGKPGSGSPRQQKEQQPPATRSADFDWQTYHAPSSSSTRRLPPKISSKSKSKSKRSGLRRCVSHASVEVMKANAIKNNKEKEKASRKGTKPGRAKSMDKDTILSSTTKTIPDLMSYNHKEDANPSSSSDTTTAAATASNRRGKALRRRASTMNITSSVDSADITELIHTQVELDGMKEEESQQDLLLSTTASTTKKKDEISSGFHSMRRQRSLGQLDSFLFSQSPSSSKSPLRRRGSVGESLGRTNVDLDTLSTEAVSPATKARKQRINKPGAMMSMSLQRRASCSTISGAGTRKMLRRNFSVNDAMEDQSVRLKSSHSHNRQRSSSVQQRRRIIPSMDMSSPGERRQRQRSTSRNSLRRGSISGSNATSRRQTPSMMDMSLPSRPRSSSTRRRDNSFDQSSSGLQESQRRRSMSSSSRRRRRSSVNVSSVDKSRSSSRPRSSTTTTLPRPKSTTHIVADESLDCSSGSTQSTGRRSAMMSSSRRSRSSRRIMDDLSSGSHSGRGERRQGRRGSSTGLMDMSASAHNNRAGMRRSRRGSYGSLSAAVRNTQLQQTLDAPPATTDFDSFFDKLDGTGSSKVPGPTNFANACDDNDTNPTEEESNDPASQTPKVDNSRLNLESLEQRSKLSMFKKQQSLALLEIEPTTTSSSPPNDDNNQCPELDASSSISSFFNDCEASDAMIMSLNASQATMNSNATTGSTLSVVLPMVEATP